MHCSESIANENVNTVKQVSTKPIVTVVIPTRGRPALMLRAVKSALAQTLYAIEVIVVVDGTDPDSTEALATLHDDRLSAVCLPTSVGGSEARNIGILAGRGEFVALLDDDDEWFPSKLSAQLAEARASKFRLPVVTSRLIARRPEGDEVWPQRPMCANEAMSEYLFCRENSIRQGEGFIQTSTLFVVRTLLLEIPFKEGLPRHQDWDWLIRANIHPDVGISWVWEPLVIYHIDAYRRSISAGTSADPSVAWVNGNELVTRKARAYFYATQVAVRCCSLAALCAVIRKTVCYPRALCIGIGLSLTPRYLVSWLRFRAISHA
jgi:glycosyltransferase involved in cell wall biosynthesis